jgi:hypothetical protein
MAFLPSNPPRGSELVRFDHVVELLAPALGKEKSEELISSFAKSHNYSMDQLSFEQALEMLTTLGEEPGIVGVSARFAKARLVMPQGTPSLAYRPEGSLPPHAETASSLRPVTATLDSGELVSLLAKSLGTEKSREVVSAALSGLGFAAGTLDLHQAQQVLDLTAQTEGIVGVTSRFAKARLMLRFKSE